ncbi:MAG: hypothetical protein GY844_12175 [Bradyrhizobium sp.]|nr:hypothetical protein [Bradyrhizobium sp.]
MRVRLLQLWGEYPAGTILSPAPALARKLIGEKIAIEAVMPTVGAPERATREPAEAAMIGAPGSGARRRRKKRGPQ